jgi:hypothetical protein
MNVFRLALCGALVGAATARAAVTFTTTHSPGSHDLDSMMSGTDLIEGLTAIELPGDTGWHPANVDPADQLPALTDGVGALGPLTGLLNDFPGAGNPTKLIQYDLAGRFDVSGINIFTGNVNNSDGRIFSTTVIRYSTDNGTTFNDLGYFQSDPSGSINNESGNAGTTQDAVTLVSIVDDAAGPLARGVTNLQFDFYSVDNTQGEMRDPFDGVNPFTGVDDGLTPAFESPLVWEIDVLGAAGGAKSDFDDDGDVDGQDFLIWQRGLGLTGTANLGNGDANGDHNVDSADLSVWRSQFGSTAVVAPVPEPTTGLAAVAAAAYGLAGIRRHGASVRSRTLSTTRQTRAARLNAIHSR